MISQVVRRLKVNIAAVMAGTNTGRRWLIVVATFMVMFFEVGTLKSFSVTFSHIIIDLDVTIGQIGKYVGLARGGSIAIGLLTSTLMRKFSPRFVAMTGSFLTGAALIPCFLATNITQFALIFAICTIGLRLSTLSSYVALFAAFSDGYDLPLGISLTGCGIGMMILPVLTQILLEAYGWRGAYLILGALNLNCVSFSALFQSTVVNRSGHARGPAGNHNQLHTQRQHGTEALNPTVREGEGEATTRANLPGDERREGWSEARTPLLPQTQPGVTKENELSIDHDGKHASLIQTDPSKTSRRCSVQRPLSLHSDEELSWCQRVCSFLLNISVSLCHVTGIHVLWRYPAVLACTICTFLYGMVYDGWILFLVPNGEAKGLKGNVAVVLAIAGGIGNTAGRILPGLFAAITRNVSPLSPRLVYAVVCVLGGLPLCLNAFANTFPTLASFAALFGLTIGAVSVLRNTAVVDLVEEDLIPSVLTLAMVSAGLGNIAGGWITGYIFDRTGSFDAAFLFLGCADFVSAILLVLSLVHDRLRELQQPSR